MLFYVGGYSTELLLARLDPEDGSMNVVSKVETPENASFLSHVPRLSALYATVESGYGGKGSGSIAAYRVGGNGTLTALGTAGTCGAGPCHVDVEPAKGLLAAANYGGENFVVIGLADDGTFGDQIACLGHEGSSVNRDRQSEPHPHATTFSPDGAYLYVCDLGTDRIMRYPVDTLGSGSGTVAAEAAPGSGPRHLAFSPDARYAYLVNELSNTVVAYAYRAEDGSLSLLEELSTLPQGYDQVSYAAEIQVHPSGRFVYASNRGHETIAVFARDEADGTLELDGFFDVAGRGPRHFQVDASGTWCLVANQGSEQVCSFRIEPQTGMGRWTGKSLSATAPACVEFLRSDASDE